MRKNRKILLMLLVLVLAISMSACGGGDDGTSDTAGDDAADSAGSIESLIDWMKTGTFSYDYKMIMEYDGKTTESEGVMAMDGGDFAITMTGEVAGTAVDTGIIIKDDKMYMVDNANKMIITMSTVSPDLTGGMPTDYADMKKSGSGEGEVDGKTLPYDEYTIEGYSVKYYMDGDKVYAIESEAEGAKSLMIIENASKSIPDGIFDLPEGYQEVSY